MNLLCKLFAGSYDNIWKAIIRPNRDKYSSNDLGPYKFELNSKNYNEYQNHYDIFPLTYAYANVLNSLFPPKDKYNK